MSQGRKPNLKLIELASKLPAKQAQKLASQMGPSSAAALVRAQAQTLDRLLQDYSIRHLVLDQFDLSEIALAVASLNPKQQKQVLQTWDSDSRARLQSALHEVDYATESQKNGARLRIEAFAKHHAENDEPQSDAA